MGSLSPPDLRSDEELIRAINQGDTAAFETLYYRYRDWVVRLATRFNGRTDDALDVLQDTFAYLLRKTPSLRLSARMTTFLYPVVKHLSLAARRRSCRSLGCELDADVPAPPPSENDGARSSLAEVMAGLSPDQREVVLMRFVDDMTLAEIAQALRMPVGTVKSKLHRALERLQNDPRTRAYFQR